MVQSLGLRAQTVARGHVNVPPNMTILLAGSPKGELSLTVRSPMWPLD